MSLSVAGTIPEIEQRVAEFAMPKSTCWKLPSEKRGKVCHVDEHSFRKTCATRQVICLSVQDDWPDPGAQFRL
jgi:hypothetical protein